MEIKDKFTTAHDDFFGNVVGTFVQTTRKTVTTKTQTDFVADWALPLAQTQH